MKSIRYALLSCLLKHGEQTMDDLETQLSGFQKKNIYSNMQAAKSEELVSMRKDDVTRLPSYKITDKGKSWVTSKVETDTCASGDDQAKLEYLTDQNQLLSSENAALRSHSLMLGQIAEIAESYQLAPDIPTVDVVKSMAHRISDLETAIDLTQQTIHQQELESEQQKERIATLESNGNLLDSTIRNPSYEHLETIVNRIVAGLTKAGFTEIDNPDEAIESLARERDLLKAENLSLKILDESMPGFGAMHEAIKAKQPPFYVSIGRDTGPQIHKHIEVATRRMKSIVRRGDPAGLVLVPILKAVKGVEVVEFK